MKLPPNFQFSQNSLQDFVDCPRRFYLRHIRRAAWPAAVADEAMEYERHMQQGAIFHRLVQQHILGIPAVRLSRIVSDAADPDLSRWWANYLTHSPEDLIGTRHPELMLSAPVAGHRLLAKYDVVVVEPDTHAVIIDWKTSRRRPRRAWLAARLQTQVYRYVLASGAGSYLNEGRPLAPAQIRMHYWFAAYPDEPEDFVYSEAEFQADGLELAGLINEIKSMAEENFVLTEDVQHCRFCVYRSLCDRGIIAGSMTEAVDEDIDADSGGFDDFDFGQVAEIEF